MATIRSVDFERSGIGKGIKVAGLLLVLAASALTADHLFFGAPRANPAAAVVAVKAEAPATAEHSGFALPENLRPTASDAADSAPTF
jgi:hypothetical protein